MPAVRAPAIASPVQGGRGPYREKIQEMIRKKETRLIVSLDDLRAYDEALLQRDEHYTPETRKYAAPLALTRCLAMARAMPY